MSHTHRLDGELTVYVVHALKDALLAALAHDPDLQLDLTDVHEMDGAGLQLLLSAQAEARQRGGDLQIAAASPQVEATLTLCRLRGAFMPEAQEV